MSLYLAIGEASLLYDAEDLYVAVEAVQMTHPDAPSNDPNSGQGNWRQPLSGVWKNFCQQAGLNELFYGGRPTPTGDPEYCSKGYHRDRPLLARQPGVQALCQGDLLEVQAAVKNAKQSTAEDPPASGQMMAPTTAPMRHWLG